MIKKIKTLFAVPNKPKALPMRLFGCNEGDYTWEDWKIDAKTKHPIRYFLSQTLPHWFAVKISMPISEFFYWLKSNTYKKYHLLDLRQTEKINDHDYYRWGWIDEDRQILFACFNVLVKHVESRRKPNSFNYSDLDLDKYEKTYGRDEYWNALKELGELYNYWTVDRKQSWKYYYEWLDDWYVLRKNLSKDTPELAERHKKLKEMEKELYKEEEEMLIRLIKIRRNLWT